MAYKGKIEEQSLHSMEELEEIIEQIEKWFTDDVAKIFSGKAIYVLDARIFDMNYFVNTTVSDVESVCGNIEINFIGNCDKIFVERMRKPKKNEWRNAIKFITPRTYAYERYIKDEDSKVIHYSFPVLQDERFVLSECKKNFENDDIGSDYDFIMEHAFIVMISDKRFQTTDHFKNNRKEIENQSKSISSNCHQVICQYFDIKESWAITYAYKNILFIFPMKQEYFKQIFKDRDIAEGKKRRGVLPTIVNEHKRSGNKTVHSHLRIGGGYATIHGRDFSFVINDIEKIYPQTDYAKKKAIQFVKNSHEENGMYASNKEEIQI